MPLLRWLAHLRSGTPAVFEETLLGLRTDAECFGIIMLHTPEIHMKTWWVGCSGFYYKHWKEKFYPKGLPQRKWFEFYCEHFNTVELNVTFYRYPKYRMV
jgi:hypothetical protein